MHEGGKLADKSMTRFDEMIKRRAMAAALPYSTCCHSFRATGITTYLQEKAAGSNTPRPSRTMNRPE
jgi:hypothetical protein